MRERASHAQRVDKILQDANIKLGSVLSDIMGKSGRAILAAIIAGTTEPTELAALVHGSVKASRETLVAALRGKVTSTHRLMLKLHLGQADALEGAVAEIAKGTYLQAQFLRLRARRGLKKAILAVASSMLMAIYHMLKNGTDYVDLGANHFVKDRTRAANQLLRKLSRLGFDVPQIHDREVIATA